MHAQEKSINDFWIVGINYRKSEASVRGKYAINNEQSTRIFAMASEMGLRQLFILSTCNRTEIYGVAENPIQLMELICSQSEGNLETFAKMAYVKNGAEAVEHLFSVGAGLDSQILGDYEILGQIKLAAKAAKEQGFICPFMERLLNSVLQSSKAVKTHTSLSGGTVSVSFAAVQYIKEHISEIADKKILLAGTGKIGRNTCKNLVDYLDTRNITLVNRTAEKAAALAEEMQLSYKPVENMNEEVASADIILVATNSQEPTILAKDLEGEGAKLIIDLSVPCNVELAAQSLPNVSFVNVDQLSKIKDETLQMRQGEVPKAVAIIKEHVAEFMEWCDMRKHVPILKEVKCKLQELHANAGFAFQDANNFKSEHPEEKIQKVINTLALKIRRNNTAGCHFIEAINEFIA